jgi:hypothetical protein
MGHCTDSHTAWEGKVREPLFLAHTASDTIAGLTICSKDYLQEQEGHTNTSEGVVRLQLEDIPRESLHV